jgi:hypothetical protein
LTVRYNLPRYSPINHRTINCTPANRKTADVTVAHPGGVEDKSASATTATNPIIPISDSIPPANAPIRRGMTEKLNNIEENRRNNLDKE